MNAINKQWGGRLCRSFRFVCKSVSCHQKPNGKRPLFYGGLQKSHFFALGKPISHLRMCVVVVLVFLLVVGGGVGIGLHREHSWADLLYEYVSVCACVFFVCVFFYFISCFGDFYFGKEVLFKLTCKSNEAWPYFRSFPSNDGFGYDYGIGLPAFDSLGFGTWQWGGVGVGHRWCQGYLRSVTTKFMARDTFQLLKYRVKILSWETWEEACIHIVSIISDKLLLYKSLL